MSLKPLRTDLSCPRSPRKSMSASMSMSMPAMGTSKSAALAAIPEVRQPASAAIRLSAAVGAASTPPRPAGASMVTKKRRVGATALCPATSWAPISTSALTPRCQLDRTFTVRLPRAGFSRTFLSSALMPSTSTSFSPRAMIILLFCVARVRECSEEVGDELRGAVSAADRHLCGMNRLAQVLEHRGAQSLRARALVVAAKARAQAMETPGHLQLLLEVVAQGKVEERGAEGCQLHGGGEPALDDSKIDGRVMLEEIRHEGAHLDPGPPVRLHLGEPRATDEDQARLRNLRGDQGEGLRAFAKEAPAHPRSSHGGEDHSLVGP